MINRQVDRLGDERNMSVGKGELRSARMPTAESIIRPAIERVVIRNIQDTIDRAMGSNRDAVADRPSVPSSGAPYRGRAACRCGGPYRVLPRRRTANPNRSQPQAAAIQARATRRGNTILLSLSLHHSTHADGSSPAINSRFPTVEGDGRRPRVNPSPALNRPPVASRRDRTLSEHVRMQSEYARRRSVPPLRRRNFARLR